VRPIALGVEFAEDACAFLLSFSRGLRAAAAATKSGDICLSDGAAAAGGASALLLSSAARFFPLERCCGERRAIFVLRLQF
jgi:hypothetical protein